MFGNAFGVKKRRSDEAEKPFWISYADLMTAMMVLFLVVMVASLSSVTQRIQRAEQGEKTRGQDIFRLCERLELHARNVNKTIVVDCHDNRISFGEAGRFDHNQFFLNAEGQKALQDVVPLVLEASNSEEGKKWFKQIVIEGFTDTDGSYLYNLHLSLQRSELVMCSLLDSKKISPQNSGSKSVNFSSRVVSPSIMPRKARKPAAASSCACSSSGLKINVIRPMRWISPPSSIKKFASW